MKQVRRRHVFYVSGFDPKGAAHYHALYRDQSRAQSLVNGMAIEVGPRKRLPEGDAAWTVKAVDQGAEVETTYEFLHWDDVVRAHWPKRQWQLWRDVIVTTLFYLRHGALWRMYKLSWPPALALLMPFMLLLLVLLGVPVYGGLAAWFAWEASDSIAVGAVAGLGVGAALVWVGLALETRYSMYWMMRSYAFTRLQALGRTPDLEARLDRHAARVAACLAASGDDEVLIVGHSSGANMACSILARALRQLPGRPAAPIALATLGHWIPLLGTLPHGEPFRRELAELGRAEQLAWIDFSAPPDGCCFALTDPLAACGVKVPGGCADRPKLLSPRFAEAFDAPGYQALRRDKFRMHFQYLMASPKAVQYDFFRMTAGAQTLAQQFATNESVTNYTRLRPFGPGKQGAPGASRAA
jgi:hypothetical protein